MARNRLLFNFLATISGLAILIAPIFIFRNIDNAGVFGLFATEVVIGGAILGFLGYKNDGLKIAGAISGIIAIFGIVFGILIMTKGAEIVPYIFPANIAGVILGIIGAVVTIVFGFLFIIALIIAAALFVGSAAVGSMIGNGVWRDKAKEELEAGETLQPSNASQAAYKPVKQPTEPVRKAGEVFCTNCGATNVAEDEFCTSCGSKLKK